MQFFQTTIIKNIADIITILRSGRTEMKAATTTTTNIKMQHTHTEGERKRKHASAMSIANKWIA